MTRVVHWGRQNNVIKRILPLFTLTDYDQQKVKIFSINNSIFLHPNTFRQRTCRTFSRFFVAIFE